MTATTTISDFSTADRLTGEGLIPFSEAAARLGKVEGRGPLSPSTLARWAQRGVRGPGGSRVSLEHLRVGCRLVTSWPAVLRFLTATTSPSTADAAPPVRSPAARSRAAADATARLKNLGF